MAEALTMASVGPKPTRHIVLKYRDSPIPRTRQRRSLQTVMPDAGLARLGSSTVLSANAVQKQEKDRVSKPKIGDRRFSRVVVSEEEEDDDEEDDGPNSGPNSGTKATLYTTRPTGDDNNSNTSDTINDRNSAAHPIPTQQQSLNPISRGKGRPSKKRKGRKPVPRPDTAAAMPLLLGARRGAPDLHDSEYLEYQKEISSKAFRELRAGALLGCELALDALDAMFAVPAEAQEEWQALDAQVAEALWGIRAQWQHLERARKQLAKSAKKRGSANVGSLSEVESGSVGEQDKDNATKSTVDKADNKDNEAVNITDNKDNEAVNITDNELVNKTDNNKTGNNADNTPITTPADSKKLRRKKPDLSVDDGPLSNVRATRSRRRSSSATATADTHHDEGATLRRSKRRRT